MPQSALFTHAHISRTHQTAPPPHLAPLTEAPPANIWDVVLMAVGPANGLFFGGAALARAAPLFAGRPVFVDHALPAEAQRPGGRSVRDLAGRVLAAWWDAPHGLLCGRLGLLPQARWLGELAQQYGDTPWFGLSADLWLERAAAADGRRRQSLSPGPEARPVARIVCVNSVDIVVNPAAGGRFIQPVMIKKESAMSDLAATHPHPPASEPFFAAAAPHNALEADSPTPDALPANPPSPTRDALAEAAVLIPLTEYVESQLRAARLPAPLAQTVRDGVARGEFARGPAARQDPAAIQGHIAALQSAWAEAHAAESISGLGRVTQMRDGLDRLTLGLERLLGLPETPAHRDAERLSGIRELYDRLTGDWERTGFYHGERVTLANATVSTMAQVTANALNKALVQAFEQREHWWQPIAYEEDFVSLNDVKWLTLGGFGDLDTVAEGNAYTEKTWDDSAESSVFVKKGNYIGLTLEMIDRDDVGAVRAIPRRLGLAAYRTLSSAVAALFTANAGAGVTLSDAAALFSAGHNNLGAAALDATSWEAAVQAMFKQSEFHSNKRLGVQPAYCLVPIELQQTAVSLFTTTLEPGRAGNTRAIERNNHSVITTVLWGTAWTAHTLLARTIRALRALEQRDGQQRVFVVSWQQVAAEVPAYRRHVTGEIARLGADHPLIKTQYLLEEIDAGGGLFPPEVQALMRGSHPPLEGPLPGEEYALLVDVAGEAEAHGDLDAALRQREPRRDSTAVTIVAVERSGPLPRYRVVARHWWTGRPHHELQGALVRLAELWGATRLVVDATGLGAGLASFLRQALGPRVTPFVFTSQSKSELGWAFRGLCASGRWQDCAALPAGHPQAAAQAQFWREVAASDYSVDGAGQTMRWGVADPTVHDDLLLSAALCGVLARESRPPSQPGAVVEAADIL